MPAPGSRWLAPSVGRGGQGEQAGLLRELPGSEPHVVQRPGKPEPLLAPGSDSHLV